MTVRVVRAKQVLVSLGAASTAAVASSVLQVPIGS